MHIDIEYIVAACVAGGLYLGWRTLRRNAPVAGSVSSTAGHKPIGAGSLAEVLELIQRGRNIEAIKRYREYCDCDLRTAKNAVEALARNPQALQPMSAPAPVAPQAMAGIELLVREGRLIEAIKLYREQHGCGLKEAKDAIDAMASGRTFTVVQTTSDKEDTLADVRDILRAQIVTMQQSNQDPDTIRKLEEAVQRLDEGGGHVSINVSSVQGDVPLDAEAAQKIQSILAAALNKRG